LRLRRGNVDGRILFAPPGSVSENAAQWRRDLAAWGIPDEILLDATESPWIHPPILFDVPATIVDSPSHQRAREVLDDGGSVLDVGCGGGIAAFALTPPATHVMGVDHQGPMLEMFAANAAERRVSADTFEGFWPAIAARVPRADVVTAHHVVYNVSDIDPFIRTLSAHATRRVVIEMPQHHPLSTLSEAWRHFWQLERPTAPTSLELRAVLEEMGIAASLELWSGPMRVEQDLDQAAHFTRIRLCLPESREAEVREFLHDNPPPMTRELATIFWDV
jgi:SAM-dependent methyltransferase